MSDLRVAVLGVGLMGADHVARISSMIAGARVAVVNDYIIEKAEQLAAEHPRLPRPSPIRWTPSPTRMSTPSSWPPPGPPTRSSCWRAWSTASRCCARNR